MSTPAESADRPGVVILPPFLYVIALVTSVLLHLLAPLTLPVGPLVRWIGGAISVVALALAIAARRAFARVGTNVNPMEPALAIATSGPFRFTRNPMYVGLSLLLIGLGLATRVGWMLVLAVPAFCVMHWGVVLREERYLTRKFGATYTDYRARVRRYL